VSLQESLDKLNNIDLNDIDFSRVGEWSRLTKAAALLVMFVVVLVAGYFFWVSPKLTSLNDATNKESDLKRAYEKKSHQASNLNEYKAQNEWLVDSFSQLLKQLPSDTEVPGLIEDITKVGIDGGLNIESIKLGNEQTQEFFIELPMTIELKGSYHNFGAFVSGVAALSRIVTLHDFSVKRSGQSDEELAMTIQAKTYRYREIAE